MIKFQKKPILVPAVPPVFIRHEAKGKHNEVTVVVAHYAVPLNSIFSRGMLAISPNVLEAALKAANGFQDIQLGFNKNMQAPALTFVIKAKTERRGDDVPNQELADKIVMAKANSKACVVAERALKAVVKYYMNEIAVLDKVCEAFTNTAARELAYIEKV